MVTIATSGSVKLAAGSYVSSALTNANYNEFIEDAESDLIRDTRVNWVDAWGSSFDAELSGSVHAAVVCKAAIKAVKYDPGEYPQGVASFIVNVNWAEYRDAVERLKDQKVITALDQTYIGE